MAMEKNLLEETAQNVVKILEKDDIHFPPEQASRVLPIIVSTFIEQAIVATKEQAAENGGEATISIKQLFDISINNRVSDDGEKDGNQMIAFIAGPQAKLLAKEDSRTEGVED